MPPIAQLDRWLSSIGSSLLTPIVLDARLDQPSQRTHTAGARCRVQGSLPTVISHGNRCTCVEQQLERATGYIGLGGQMQRRQARCRDERHGSRRPQQCVHERRVPRLHGQMQRGQPSLVEDSVAT